MFTNGRKTIGAFLSQINVDFQETLIRGISVRAKELDYNVAFFTNFGGYGQVEYDIGEINIVEVPSYEDLDGIIIAPDTMAIDNMDIRIREHIKNESKCPVVSVRRKAEEYYNVLIDDDTVLEELVRHFVEIHGFTRFNFLAGPKEFVDSEKRLNMFRRVLAEYHITVEDERIYYGDFWKFAASRAVDEWLLSPLERPQVIICANDYMAIAACNALIEKGFNIPGDIAVSGCDDIEDAAEFSPSITTARTPVFDMGVEAVDKINRHILGIEQPRNSYMKTTTIYRESCGCKKNWYQESNERRRNHILAREALKIAINHNSYMSTGLTGLTKLEEVNEKLKEYVYQNEGLRDFYMCLKKDWDTYRGEEKEEPSDKSNEMIMELGIKRGNIYSKYKFSKKLLIPSKFSEDQPMIFYIAMLHHQGNCFGYTAISYEKLQTYMLTFQAWLGNVSNALENVRVHGELNRLVYKLEDMYIRDDLTDLYNRRGINNLGQKYLKQCKEKNVRLMIFTADMDKLKFINDNYGHAKGDIALKVVADALQKAADDDEICMRFGGDEFMAIGYDYDEKKLDCFINKLIEGLEEFNEDSGNEFKVYISYGWSLILPTKNTTIEECLNIADTKMYQQKYEKRAMKVKANLYRE